MKPIYLDNAATTKVAPEVLKAMLPFFRELFGNAASEYRFSAEVRKAVETSRETISSFLGASPFEIYFTSGGTESDNWAIKAAAQAMRSKGNHIIANKIMGEFSISLEKFLYVGIARISGLFRHFRYGEKFSYTLKTF